MRIIQKQIGLQVPAFRTEYVDLVFQIVSVEKT